MLPPWWDTLGFRMLMGIGVAALLFGAVRWRFYAIERQNRKLAALVTERTRKLEESNQKLEEASLTDRSPACATGRFVHEHIAHHLNRALRQSRRGTASGEPADRGDIVFVLIDLDHFKRINDEYGHDAGDRVLIGMRDLLTSVCRESDILVRWGGEEFLVVCLSTSSEVAFRTADRNPSGGGAASLRYRPAVGERDMLHRLRELSVPASGARSVLMGAGGHRCRSRALREQELRTEPNGLRLGDAPSRGRSPRHRCSR